MAHETKATSLGRTTWAFAAGHMPDGSTGREPDFTSRDELSLLNTGDDDACASVLVYRTDDDPIGPYEILVGARRVKVVRINDLIDPRPIPLGVPYAFTINSDRPVVAQLTHIDTRQAELGVSITSGLAGEF